MQLSPAEVDTATRAGIAALQRGDAVQARRSFEQAVAAGPAPPPPLLLMLAQACRLGGDGAAESAALDRLLAGDPQNLRGLIMRGDTYGRAGDVRAANSFYQAALAVAATAGPLPPGLTAELRRAEAYVAEAGRRYEAWLVERVAPAAAGPRFEEAIDILLGRKQIQLQQPSAFYFPGLPQVPFYEREGFDWAKPLETATDAIRAELLALIETGADFQPYVEAEEDRPRQDFHGMLGDPSWGAFYLWKDGSLVEENAARCPLTMEALTRLPMSRIGARTPSVLFSLLRPGAHIPPHHGMLNSRLICHLPLVVPPGCWLRVGNETRIWEEGKLLIFDDSIEHEAKNGSDKLRVILLFDVWRPELSDAERSGVSAIFEAIDGFGPAGGGGAGEA